MSENTTTAPENNNASTSNAGEQEKKEKKDKTRYCRFPIRVRPHVNPLGDDGFDTPNAPWEGKWDEMYPKYAGTGKRVEYVDVGCAYGGLICKAAMAMPDTLMLGIEIRQKVVEYSQGRVKELREQANDGKSYENAWFINSNAMKYLPNHFEKGQLKRISFCFPDPHFKKKNFRRRIINHQLLADYAYVLAKGGLLYTITDVKELGDWMQKHLDEHPLFERIDHEKEMTEDPLLPLIGEASEDAMRTNEKRLNKYCAIFRRK